VGTLPGVLAENPRGALFRDPDPVPAIAELRAGGLRDVPQTKLT